MQTDCSFTIGSSHSICQDYALANDKSIVVCDGCSSSPHTDVGARILAHHADGFWLTAKDKTVDLNQNVANYHSNSIVRAIQTIRTINVPEQSLDATLLAATVVDGSIIATAHGDGSVILRRKADKSLLVHTISYKENYPYYPSYLTNDKRNTTWQGQSGNIKTIETTIIKNGDVSSAITESQSPFELFVYDANEYDIVLLSSDGIETFVEKSTNTPIPLSVVLGELLDFKVLQGSFIERRLKAFMTRTATAKGWSNFDDVSLAGIYMGDV